MSEKKMSSNKKAALKSIESICGKLMVWAPFVAFFAWLTDGKFITTDVWKALVPLGIVAGIVWYWAVGRLPDEK